MTKVCVVLSTEVVVQVEGRSQRASVRLVASQETVSVRLKELGDRNDVQPGAADPAAVSASASFSCDAG